MYAVAWLSLSLFVLNNALLGILGSKILFEKSHASITPLLTKTMTLRCSLCDTTPITPSGAVVGRDLQQTLTNVEHVTSVIVMRNNSETVAAVSVYSPAKALTDLDILSVTGQVTDQVTGSSGQKGYIELTWQHPDKSSAGQYVCEINGVDNVGHNVRFTATVAVDVTEPSVSDLVEHIVKLESEKDIMKSQIADLTTEKDRTNTQIANLTTEKDRMNAQIIDLKTEKNNMKIQIAHLSDNQTKIAIALNHPKNIESGEINCDDSNSWSVESGVRVKRVNVKFQTPYSKPPVVYLAINKLYNNHDVNTQVGVHLLHVDIDSFTMQCDTYNHHMNVIYYLRSTWISIED